MEAAISAIGNATPLYHQEQTNVFELMAKSLQLDKAHTRLLKMMYREAGISSRYSVLDDFTKLNGNFTFFPNDASANYPSTQKRMAVYKDNAILLAASAIQNCFSTLKHFDQNKITHLITISCTGMSAPGLDIEIMQNLDLPKTIQRTTINFMGCYGVFNGLKMANSICKADKNSKVLLVSVELCTIHFQKNNSIDNLISSTIFADGAGALLIESADPNKKQFVLRDFYCDLIPEGQNEMTWEIGDQGFDIRLSSYVPQLIENGIAKFFTNLLSRQSLVLKDIDYFAIHPGSKRILEACERSLGISPEDNRFSYEVLNKYGNMSSATIIFVLKRLWEHITKSDNNKNTFCCAFGPGLTLESMVLTLHDV